MKIISAKKNKCKKKSKFKKYWRTLEPKDYVDLMIANSDKLIKIAYSTKKKEVTLSGKLKKTDDGFCYIDVDDKVIDGLKSLIKEDNIKKPPYFGKDGIGAHISVISDKENPNNKLNIEEIGKEFNFKLGDFYCVKPEGWKEMEMVWFVEFDAPELKKLRIKYDLPESYNGKGHNFHCTIAVRSKND